MYTLIHSSYIYTIHFVGSQERYANTTQKQNVKINNKNSGGTSKSSNEIFMVFIYIYFVWNKHKYKYTNERDVDDNDKIQMLITHKTIHCCSSILASDTVKNETIEQLRERSSKWSSLNCYTFSIFPSLSGCLSNWNETLAYFKIFWMFLRKMFSFCAQTNRDWDDCCEYTDEKRSNVWKAHIKWFIKESLCRWREIEYSISKVNV